VRKIIEINPNSPQKGKKGGENKKKKGWNKNADKLKKKKSRVSKR